MRDLFSRITIGYIDGIGLMPAPCQHHTAKRCYNHFMKNVSTILTHLTNQPQFKVLKRQKCYQKYLSLLGKKWQKAIAFVYVRNDTLFVAVTHPGFKMELHYNRDLLKSVLTQLSSLDSDCRMMRAEKVVVFASKYHTIIPKKDTPSTIPYYHESATGAFPLEIEDEALKERFEKTKELIRCNR